MFLYLFIINALAFLLMLIDKWKAKKNLWRIPEKTLFLAALLGGALGGIAGMYLVRHKTKHWQFTFGFPLILAVQTVIFILILG